MAGPLSTSKALTIQACPGGATITGPDTVRPDYLYSTGGPFVVRGVTFRASACAASSCHDANGSALLECDGCHDFLAEDVTFVGDATMDDHQQMFYQRLGRNVTCRRCVFVANGSKGFGVHQYPGSTVDPATVVEASSFSGFGATAAGVTTDSRITVRDSTFTSCYLAIQLRNSAGGSILERNHAESVTILVQNPSLASVNTWN